MCGRAYIRGKVTKSPHTIFIIYANNSGDLKLYPFLNTVPVLFSTLVPAFHRLLDVRRKKNVFD
jgi:hypothetical protein